MLSSYCLLVSQTLTMTRHSIPKYGVTTGVWLPFCDNPYLTPKGIMVIKLLKCLTSWQMICEAAGSTELM